MWFLLRPISCSGNSPECAICKTTRQVCAAYHRYQESQERAGFSLKFQLRVLPFPVPSLGAVGAGKEVSLETPSQRGGICDCGADNAHCSLCFATPPPPHTTVESMIKVSPSALTVWTIHTCTNARFSSFQAADFKKDLLWQAGNEDWQLSLQLKGFISLRHSS